jgi:hypothetical protein
MLCLLKKLRTDRAFRTSGRETAPTTPTFFSFFSTIHPRLINQLGRACSRQIHHLHACFRLVLRGVSSTHVAACCLCVRVLNSTSACMHHFNLLLNRLMA